MSSWRPCSSTSLKFIDRWAGSSPGRKASGVTAQPRAFSPRVSAMKAISAGTSPGRRAAPSLGKLGGELRHRHQLGADLLRQRLHQLQHLLLSNPGTSHSQRSAGTWLRCGSGTVSVTPSSAAAGLEVMVSAYPRRRA